MSSITATALSGALTQSQRLANSATNIANARTTGALPPPPGGPQAGGPPPPGGPEGTPPPFQPLAGGQEAVAGPNGGQGTRPVFRPANPSYLPEYAPESPFANPDGLVAAPNVDLARERVEQMQGLRSYQANLAALRTANEMEREILNLKA
ncbi:MAG TPA: flagellar basal body rod C-terminal domain-containing protein [Azospirillaceae bacterium]|nr:flagellar basal body rod C-terminal domain-containing protein [Azospirillaceae bacterium]